MPETDSSRKNAPTSNKNVTPSQGKKDITKKESKSEKKQEWAGNRTERTSGSGKQKDPRCDPKAIKDEMEEHYKDVKALINLQVEAADVVSIFNPGAGLGMKVAAKVEMGFVDRQIKKDTADFTERCLQTAGRSERLGPVLKERR